MTTLRRYAGKLFNIARDSCLKFAGPHLDRTRSLADIPASRLLSHSNFSNFLVKLANHENYKILEIGSREVTGPSGAREKLWKANYIGFDYRAGANVDVVGDAHHLSDYFEPEQFDIIYSRAVFEHLAMPWLVAAEIAKVLKVGGFVLIETHFSYSSHERPWHFFQFSDMALRVLFSPALGFECIEAGVSNPIVGRYSAFSDDYLRYRPVNDLFCHSAYLGRKARHVEDFAWCRVDLREAVGSTEYPLSAPAPQND